MFKYFCKVLNAALFSCSGVYSQLLFVHVFHHFIHVQYHLMIYDTMTKLVLTVSNLLY